MKIRVFKDGDRDQVSKLWTDVFGYSAPHNNTDRIITAKCEFQRELFFVAIVDERVVGTVMGGYDGHRGWIYSLAVEERSRHQGLGTNLVKRVEKALKEIGCPKINLQLVGSNAVTLSFYHGLGYSIEDRISMGKVVTK